MQKTWLRKTWFLSAVLPALLAGCNSGTENNKVKEPEAAVVQTVTNDTVITVFEGVRPCKGCKQINTEIQFTRSVHDTTGTFKLKESYINKKDSAYQNYLGTGTYKIMPSMNGEIKGIALYNMALDDKTQGFIYLLQDSLTLLKADLKGKPVAGDEAIMLKRSK
jgi:NlpE N-terminal domain